MKFTDLNLIPSILKAIEDKGYTEPTPIQQQAITPILEGRDLLGCAQTGTGKTAAFAIPTLQRLCQARGSENWPRGIKALIVTPTRELAIQIDESFAAYGKETGLRHTVIFGGVKQHWQVKKIKSGIDVLVATPGRLLDLMNQGIISLDTLQIFTLDEADRMLDMGFIHDVKKIIKVLPKKRQSLFFSATMPANIIDLANSLLTNPVKVEVTPVSSTAETIEQKLYLVDKGNKRPLLVHLLQDENIESVLVFSRTKHGANKIADYVNKAGITAEAIHGNKTQNARQRALSNFKSRETRVLVATDIAARGIDVDKLSHVINFDIPNEPETYVHRIGRTGRAKRDGVAMSFCEPSEKSYMRDIYRLTNVDIPIDHNHPYPVGSASVHLDSEDSDRAKSNHSRKPRQNRWRGRGGRR